MFATRIEQPSPDDPELDWRRAPRGALRLTPTELDAATAAGIRALVKGLGLQFAVVDLAECADGGPVLLELNLGGQWGWVELSTGQRVSHEIATQLAEADGSLSAVDA